jgi:serine/threonine protein kinase/tetratricopeptide (TPR) repeat protein
MLDEQSLFHRALELPATERAAFLARACGADEGLRRGVEGLLRAHEAGDGFLARPAVEAARLDSLPHDLVALPPAGPREGSRIGGFVLLQEIGTGGMGTVYMAEQTEPVRRRVALKVVQAGLDSRQVLARFEAERQALALMDHPNIAKVLEAGATGSGQPYFVMELVKGPSLLEYCRRRNTALRERIALFVQVCHAVQHAHQKGIIHRDLKPSNVLVALYDGRPVPKVIDFGLAKAMGPRLTDRTMFTAFGQVVGTFEYMSPEQAELNQLDVDTRSDVYSLGVLLYALLTGTTPLEEKRVRESALFEILRLIREEEPPPPSTRLTSAEAAPEGPEVRREWSGLVRGDLDWIVMRALEKDRQRRYETAAAFADDLDRYLRDEPVLARPPSAGYRLRKLVRRHRGAMIAAGLVALSLLGGLAGTAAGLVRAQRAREDEARQRLAAEAQGAEASRSAEQERDAKLLAERRLAQLRRMNEILSALFTDLNPKIGAVSAEALHQRMGTRLAQAADLLDAEAIGDPESGVMLLGRIAEAQRMLGFQEEAVAGYRRAHRVLREHRGEDDPAVLVLANNLALAYGDAGRFAECAALFEEILPRMRLALGPEDHVVLAAAKNLGTAYSRLGRHEDAIPLLEDTVERLTRLRPQQVETLVTRGQLGEVYTAAGRTAEALPLLRDAVEGLESRLGPNHVDTLTAAVHLGTAELHAGRAGAAIRIFERAWREARAAAGPDSPVALGAAASLGAALAAGREPGPAIALLEEIWPLARDRFGDAHPTTVAARARLGQAYATLGRIAEAVPMVEAAHEAATRGGDPPLSSLGWIGHLLAELCDFAGDGARAESLYRRTLAGEGPGDPVLRAVASVGLARALLQRGDHAEAEALLRTALATLEEWAPASFDRLHATALLGTARLAAGDSRAAGPLLERAFEEILAQCESVAPWRFLALGDAVLGRERWHEATSGPEHARAWRREAIERILRRAEGVGPPVAEGLVREVLRIEPTSAKALRALAAALAAASARAETGGAEPPRR